MQVHDSISALNEIYNLIYNKKPLKQYIIIIKLFLFDSYIRFEFWIPYEKGVSETTSAHWWVRG